MSAYELIQVNDRYPAKHFRKGNVVQLDNGKYCLLLKKDTWTWTVVVNDNLEYLSNGLFSSISYNEYVRLISK